MMPSNVEPTNDQAFFSHIENYLEALSKEDDDDDQNKRNKISNEQVISHYYNLYANKPHLQEEEKPLKFDYRRLNYLIQSKYDVYFKKPKIESENEILNLDENQLLQCNTNSTVNNQSILSNHSNNITINSNEIIESQNSQLEKQKIFEGIKILLICGKYMSNQQANIHLNNIKKRGGYCEIYKNNLNDNLFNYIISGNENIEKIKEIYPNYLNCKILNSNYIIDCIQQDRLITKFGNYEIKQNNSQNNSQLDLNNSILSLPSTSIHNNNNNTSSSNNSINSNNEIKKLERKERYLNSFICVSGSQIISEQTCPNIELANLFDQLYKHYNGNNDTFRALAYKKATTIIRKLNFPITNIEQLNTIKGIGEKVRDKIKEYLTFGKIKRVEGLSNSSINNCIQEFTKIWGVGQKTASQFYALGYRSILDLDKSKLNAQQLIGLKYYHEFQNRIPRSEVERISKIVQNVARELCSNVICETCGSYRRGKSDSGDVDILITLKNDQNDQYSSSSESNDDINEQSTSVDGLLQRLVSKLEEMSIITDTLSMSCKLHIDQDENDTFMGVYYLPDVGIHRRIDIKVYRREHFAFALLYFTGSDHFNRSMRLLCRKKGYSLSDKSLCINTIRDSKSNRIHDGKKIICKTELEIFEFIGIPYKEPNDRDV